MNTRVVLATMAAASTLLVSGLAGAQPKDVPREAGYGVAVPKAPENALELKVGFDYSQGFGGLGKSLPTLTDLGTAGGELQLGVGYRLNPDLMLGVYGTADEFGRGSNVNSSASLYSATAGIEANWHFLPNELWDPFVGIGTGWRGYWVGVNQGTTSLHGWQIARLDLGIDYRMAEAVSMAPVIGIDLTTFFGQQLPGQTTFYNVGTPEVNTFIYAGLLGRFDIPTGGSSSARTASR
jgi:Outer membrane protein beta-barrel domain